MSLFKDKVKTGDEKKEQAFEALVLSRLRFIIIVTDYMIRPFTFEV